MFDDVVQYLEKVHLHLNMLSSTIIGMSVCPQKIYTEPLVGRFQGSLLTTPNVVIIFMSAAV